MQKIQYHTIKPVGIKHIYKFSWPIIICAVFTALAVKIFLKHCESKYCSILTTNQAKRCNNVANSVSQILFK